MAKRHYWFLASMCALAALFMFALPSCQGTCDTSESCSSSEYCSIQTGNCLTSLGIGFCKPKPSTCPNITSQVCGCDGKTYQNACTASLAGASVAATGPCAPGCGNGPCVCGGPTNQQCDAGFYCDYSAVAAGMMTTATNCLTPNAQGACTPIPTSCTTVSSPVCGCDGKTYENACLAAAAATSVASAGACPCVGDTCPQGQFCDRNIGTCGTPASVGVCHTPAMDCKGVPYSPVCGCDGKTYDNLCEAGKVSVSVEAMGGCVCGGDMDLKCPAGEYCALASGACLMPNAPGNCANPPAKSTCTIVNAPVCGCDNKVYKNACDAATNGVNVATNLTAANPVCP